MKEKTKIPKPLMEKFRKRLYTTDHEVGENNVEILGMDIHNPVFFVTALAVVGFVLFTLVFPELANAWLNGAKDFAVNTFDWFFVSSANLFVLFCLVLIVSPYGSIRIGGMNANQTLAVPHGSPCCLQRVWVSVLCSGVLQSL